MFFFGVNNTTGRERLVRKFQSIPPLSVVVSLFFYTDIEYIVYKYTYLQVLRINADLNHQLGGWRPQQQQALTTLT